jgi:hypothetical protein
MIKINAEGFLYFNLCRLFLCFLLADLAGNLQVSGGVDIKKATVIRVEPYELCNGL